MDPPIPSPSSALWVPCLSLARCVTNRQWQFLWDHPWNSVPSRTQYLQVAGVSQWVDHAWQTCKVWSISFFKILQTTFLKIEHKACWETVIQNWGQKDIAVEHKCNKLNYLSHFLSIFTLIDIDMCCWGLWSLMDYLFSPSVPGLQRWFLVVEASSLAAFLCTLRTYLSSFLVCHKNLHVYY